MYDGHTCKDHDHDAAPVSELDTLPQAADGGNLDKQINDLIQKVFDQKVKAGDVDAPLWKATTEEYWKAIQSGWADAPKYFSKEQIQILELRRNVNIFSAFKNHVNIIELNQALVGDDGKPLSFSKFKKIALGISDKYNVNWLQTEYQYAKSAAASAARWSEYQRKGGMITYMTINDGRVRDQHKVLHLTTLPVDHPFWIFNFPPNGFRCRCYTRLRPDGTVEVLPTQIPEVPEMFKNNVGITSQIFTNAHPFIREAGGAMAEKIRLLAEHESMRWERTFIKEMAQTNLVGKTLKIATEEFSGSITFTNRGLKEATNQPHRNILAKNRAILNIESLLKGASYIGAVPSSKTLAVKAFHYFAIEIEGEVSYAVVKELHNGEKVFYTIVDELKG